MAKFKSFRIETDKQIARAILKPGTATRREIMARANLAGEHYRQLARRSIRGRGYGSASSPFDKKNQLSITDKAAWRKPRVEGGKLILEVDAPAAEFAERGNEGAEGNEFMKIRLKSSVKKKRKRQTAQERRAGKGRARVTPNSFVSKGEDGRLYLFTRRVRPARARNLLRKAVESAFGNRRA